MNIVNWLNNVNDEERRWGSGGEERGRYRRQTPKGRKTSVEARKEKKVEKEGKRKREVERRYNEEGKRGRVTKKWIGGKGGKYVRTAGGSG